MGVELGAEYDAANERAGCKGNPFVKEFGSCVDGISVVDVCP